MKKFVLALFAIALISSPAMAGTKGNGTITVKNLVVIPGDDSGGGDDEEEVIEEGEEPSIEPPLWVIVLPKGQDFPEDEDEFFDEGGKVIEYGDVATFKSLKAGDYRIYAFVFEGSGPIEPASDSTPLPGLGTSILTNLKKNQTKNFAVEADGETLAISQLQSSSKK